MGNLYKRQKAIETEKVRRLWEKRDLIKQTRTNVAEDLPKEKCSYPSCNDEAWNQGYCKYHYDWEHSNSK